MEFTMRDSNKETSQKAAKHQRVNAACDECRLRKIRCDARKPVCSPCAAKNRTSSCYWGIRRRRGPGMGTRRRGSIDSPGNRPRTESNSPPAELPRSDREHDSEAIPMMGWVEEDPQTSPNASMSSFVQQIRTVTTEQIGSSQPAVVEKSHRHSSSDHRSRNNRPCLDRDLVLPSRSTADHLIETYWHLLDPLYPFLDREEISMSYDELLNGNSLKDSNSIFICLLNALFALTSLVDPTVRPEERVERGDAFYKRARELSDLELTKHRSLMSIQCLLLLGQYLQSTSESQECWHFVGLAVRTAQGIGLDLPPSGSQSDNSKQKNLRQRVWYGCILMDRMLSTIFGRPGIIAYRPLITVPLPDPHFDDSQCTCFTDISSLGSNFKESHFFIERIKLYELIGDAFLAVYYPSTLDEGSDSDPYAPYFGIAGVKAAQMLLEVDSKIWLWSRNLPPHLRHDVEVDRSGTHLRQSNILHLISCHARVLLFRPVLSRLCSQSESSSDSHVDSMWYKFAIQCSTTCVKSACDIISFFVSTMEDKSPNEFENLLPFWWYSTYYVYTAAMVLLAERLHLRKTSEVSEAKIKNCWWSAIMILHRFEPYGSHVKQSITSLMTIFERVRHRRVQEELIQRQSPIHNHQELSPAQQDHGADHVRIIENTTGVTNVTDPSIVDYGQIQSQMGSNAGQVSLTDDADIWLDEPYDLMFGTEGIPPDIPPNLDFFTIPDFELDPNDMAWLKNPFTLGTT